jgi:hypothetical protein
VLNNQHKLLAAAQPAAAPLELIGVVVAAKLAFIAATDPSRFTRKG